MAECDSAQLQLLFKFHVWRQSGDVSGGGLILAWEELRGLLLFSLPRFPILYFHQNSPRNPPGRKLTFFTAFSNANP